MNCKCHTISIVTPSFNQGSFIEDAIRSVLAQNYYNFEHIIIDGGSNDQTLEILKKYPHLVWTSEPDRGQSHALNKGFSKANGDLLGWLNADDYFLPNIFEKVLDFYNLHPDADVIFGHYYWVDEKGKIIRKVKVLNFDLFIFTYYGPYIPSSGCFFSKRIFEEGYWLNENHHYNMDRELFIRLGKNDKKFYRINEFLSCFRDHGLNKSLKYRILKGNERKKIEEEQEREAKIVLHTYGIKLFKQKYFNEIIFKFLRKLARLKYIFLKIIEGYYFQ